MCDVRKAKQRTNKPLNRFEMFSPYSGTSYTQSQLDMRRKAEILKYSSNRMPSQTNQVTRKEKWARLVTTDGKPARLVDPESIICTGETTVQTVIRPTSSSDVPGPVVYLYNDSTVPLYNYIVSRTYAVEVPNPDNYWKTFFFSDVELASGDTGTVASININQNIDKSTYTYSLRIPIAIHVEGTATGSSSSITAWISSSTLQIYCNGTLLSEKTQTDSSTTLSMTATFSAATDYSITKYIGSIQFTDIELEVSSIYVFDFKWTPTLSTTATSSTISDSWVYANVSDSVPDTISPYSSITVSVSQSGTRSTASLYGV